MGTLSAGCTLQHLLRPQVMCKAVPPCARGTFGGRVPISPIPSLFVVVGGGGGRLSWKHTGYLPPPLSLTPFFFFLLIFLAEIWYEGEGVERGSERCKEPHKCPHVLIPCVCVHLCVCVCVCC
eukprot:Sspe_Gene.113331::Locus_97390_Transcript_1_1_Confidence_1.000_Length_555::g.113331::m.113331